MTASSKITHKARTFERLAAIIDNTLRDGQFFFNEHPGHREPCPLVGLEFHEVRQFQNGRNPVVSMYFTLFFDTAVPNTLKIDRKTLQTLGLADASLSFFGVKDLDWYGYTRKDFHVQLTPEICKNQLARAIAKKGYVQPETERGIAEILAKKSPEYKEQLSVCKNLERQLNVLAKQYNEARMRLLSVHLDSKTELLAAVA